MFRLCMGITALHVALVMAIAAGIAQWEGCRVRWLWLATAAMFVLGIWLATGVVK